MDDTHHSQLVKAGAKLDEADSTGWTPLNITTLKGHLDVVQEVGWFIQRSWLSLVVSINGSPIVLDTTHIGGIL